MKNGINIKPFPQYKLALAIASVVTLSSATAQAAPVQARRAYDFVDTICVVTHVGYDNTPYGNFDVLKQRLVELGVRHIRDGDTRDWAVSRFQELADLGIKTTLVMNPTAGLAPNATYWTNSPGYTLNDFIKNRIGVDTIDAVEISNEIDLNYDKFRWYKGDTQILNNDPASSRYWVPYIRALTKDTFNAINSDPATAHLKVIGPSLGGNYSYSNRPPLGDLGAVVDWGNVHSYPNNGNPYNYPFAYNTIAKYYYTGNFPTVNIDENPFIQDMFEPIYPGKPLVATETGYFTNRGHRGLTEKAHGQYMPRLFLEYFRKGFARTCSYEFLDEWDNPGDSESNYGLLRNDMSRKPAFTAVKNMIAMLEDNGSGATSFRPGTLDYSIAVAPPAGYNRTQYVHSLLLQKANGKFYLALWHEISNGDISSTPTRDISPPGMDTTVSFNTAVGTSAVMHSWDDAGNVTTETKAIANGQFTTTARERLKVFEITPDWRASGTGLRGQYFDNADFTSLKSTRTDATIDFSWTGAPASTGITQGDSFSARWAGMVEAPVSGAYTFTTRTDDGVRLWVNGSPLVNDWNNQAVTENSGTINLMAGQRYPIQMDFYDNVDRAESRLFWSYPGRAREIVPQSRLYELSMEQGASPLIASPSMLTRTSPGAAAAGSSAAPVARSKPPRVRSTRTPSNTREKMRTDPSDPGSRRPVTGRSIR